MPLALNTPKATSAAECRIRGFEVSDIDGATAPRLCIRYALGNTVDTTFVPVRYGEVYLDGAIVKAAMNKAPAGATLYDAIKTALYDLLQDHPDLGAGTVS